MSLPIARLGRTGLRVCRLCLGCMSYGDPSWRQWILGEEVAGELGVPAAQVALAWLLRQGGVTAPIVGATRLDHLDQAAAATCLELDDAHCARLEASYRPHPVRGHQ